MSFEDGKVRCVYLGTLESQSAHVTRSRLPIFQSAMSESFADAVASERLQLLVLTQVDGGRCLLEANPVQRWIIAS